MRWRNPTIKFSLKYFKFHKCVNFTIRRGVKSYDSGEKVKLTTSLLYCDAVIKNCQAMRFCDIPESYFKHWHMSNGKCSEEHCRDRARNVMSDIYDGFSENEIVTLIWFVVLK